MFGFFSRFPSIGIATSALLGAGLLLSGCVVVAWFARAVLIQRHNDVVDWVAAFDQDAERTLPAEMMREMVWRGVVRLNTETFEIDLLDCALPDLENVTSPPGWRETDAQREERAVALARFTCRRLLRSDIRDPIERWNASLRISAVRDTDVDLNRDSASAAISGARPSAWLAESRLGLNADELVVAAADAAPGREPSPDIYGFIACRDRDAYADWRTAVGRSIVWSRDLSDGEALTVQIIGGGPDGRAPVVRATGASVVGAPERICPGVQEKRACPTRPDVATCTPEQPPVWRFELRAADGRGSVAIDVEGTRSVPSRLLEYVDAEVVTSDREAPSDARVELVGEALAIWCWTERGRRSDRVRKFCKLGWRSGAARRDTPRTPSFIVSRKNDDTPLTDEHGRTTVGAVDRLGAETVIGLGRPDWTSLAVRGAGAAEEVKLTLDPVMQASTVAVLREALGAPATFEVVGGSGSIPGLTHPRARAFDDDRSAAIVIIEVDGSEAGAIRAAAGWPEPEPGLNAWDVSAMRAWRPANSPIDPVTWTFTDADQTPGSTIKLVTALAAIERASQEGGDLYDLLLGETPAGVRAKSGLACNDTAYYLPPPIGSVINNAFASENVCYGLGWFPDTCADVRGVAAGGGERYGLCEALAVSNNIWFAQIAMQTEFGVRGFSLPSRDPPAEEDAAARAERLRRDAEREREISETCAHAERIAARRASEPASDRRNPSRLGAVVERLGWGRRLDVRYGEKSEDAREGFSYAVPPMLDSATIDLDGGAERIRERYNCGLAALNGYGQAAQASPLSLAALAAGVANEGRTPPIPYLYASPRRAGASATAQFGAPLVPTGGPAGARRRSDILLDHLREGMRAVVMDNNGSSFNAFRHVPEDLRRRIRAKTGTATPRTGRRYERLYTAWLIGWVEMPAEDEVSGLTKRYAFACSVSHTTRFGGAVCGPIMARLLTDLHVQEGL